MFDKTKVAVCATSLVGFRADTSASYAALSAAQKASTSGYYFNDLPGLDFEVIDSALSKYQTDAKTYLANVYTAELQNIITQFIESQKTQNAAKEILSNQNFTSGVAKFTDRITQNARFVGYLIKPHESNNIQSTITSLGMQVTATQATALKIYLYETSQNVAIATFDFTLDSELSLVWRDVTTFITNYQSSTGGTGQMFYLGYYEKDPANPQDFQLQSQALRMDFSCNCSGSPKLMWGKYMGVWPIEINNADLNWDGTKYTIPTPTDIWSNTTSNTYGLQAKINVKCDLTALICANISMFAKAFQHAVAARILLDAYATKRINSVADSTADTSRDFAIHYQGILNGYTNKDGIKIKGILDLLTMDFSGLDKYCSPCNPREITFGNLIR